LGNRAEQELVQEAQRGSREAFAKLLERYRHAAKRLAARLLGDPDEAEDAAQDSFTKAIRSLSQLEDPAKFWAWLTTIVVNECRRRSRRQVPLSLPVIEVPDLAADGPARVRELGAVLAEVAARVLQMPPRQSAAAAWFYFHGASYSEIAESLETTPVAVQSALQRARGRLRVAMGEIFRRGEAIMENSQSDLDIVISRPELVVGGLGLGEHRWGENVVSAHAINRSGSRMFLGFDVRACVASGITTNWQRQWYYELGAGEERELSETYEISYIFSPWYARFRGPGLARVRVTFALLTEGDFHNRVAFLDCPRKLLFQKWFEVVVPADGESYGVPVKPILPKAGDITLQGVELPSLLPGEHETQLTLANCTPEPRDVCVWMESPGWGTWTIYTLPQDAVTTLRPRYLVHENWQALAEGGKPDPAILLTVTQLPLNMAELDIGGEEGVFAWQYASNVPEATVARERFVLR
jgi:RNA polymerase sigma-70 factor (ECF subfamily)